jgi:MOB kinase activator 1
MSFFQSLHLNNGHTIRSTKGFRPQHGATNAQQNQQHQQQQQQQQQLRAEQQQQQQQYSITSHKDIKDIVESTLGSGSALAQAVKLPKDESLNEWLAVHTVDFYNQLNMLYGTLTPFCSPETCPKMTATAEYEYLWQSSSSSSSSSQQLNNKPQSMPAPKYIESLMAWCQGLFDDENVFPTKPSEPFPAQFHSLVKTVMKRLFRVYAHIYCHHFNEVLELGINPLLNTSFKHFVLFVDEFGLVAERDFGPLQLLVDEMLSV